MASNNDYIGTTAPCGFGPTGPDIVMEYVAAANGTVSYTLSPPASTRWIVVVSSGACGTLTPEESCGSEFGSPIMGSFSVTMGNSYFFYAIDSTSGADPLPNPLPIDITFTPALAGPVLDDFERGAPLQSFWTAGGDAGWTVSSTMPINGAFSAQAGTITDDESSTLSIDVFCAAAGDVGFDYRVDSESGFDFLDFSVDSVIPTGGSWSGSVSGNASFMLTAGAHTLTWDYNKDFIASSGMDTAWIDDVRLVGCSVVGAPIAASGSSVGLAGSIDATDPQWARPITCSSTTPADHYYDAFPITNTTGAAQTVTVTAAWAGGDGYLHAYSDPLDVTSTSGCITGDDDFGSPPASGSQMASVAIANNETIWIIASTFGATDPIGAYTIDVATD